MAKRPNSRSWSEEDIALLTKLADGKATLLRASAAPKLPHLIFSDPRSFSRRQDLWNELTATAANAIKMTSPV